MIYVVGDDHPLSDPGNVDQAYPDRSTIYNSHNEVWGSCIDNGNIYANARRGYYDSVESDIPSSAIFKRFGSNGSFSKCGTGPNDVECKGNVENVNMTTEEALNQCKTLCDTHLNCVAYQVKGRSRSPAANQGNGYWCELIKNNEAWSGEIIAYPGGNPGNNRFWRSGCFKK